MGEPFRGVDANQIAAALVQRLNLNSNLCDTWSDPATGAQEVAAPPMTLKLRDLKHIAAAGNTPGVYNYIGVSFAGATPPTSIVSPIGE